MSDDTTHSKLAPRDVFSNYITEDERDHILKAPTPQVLNGLLVAFSDLPSETKRHMAESMVGLATKGTFVPPHVELFYQTLCKTPSGRRAQTEGLEAITQWVGIGDTATLSILVGAANTFEDKPLPQGLQREVSDRLTEEVSKRAKGNPNLGDAREVCNLFTRYIVRPQ